jgi:HNH endonuclease
MTITDQQREFIRTRAGECCEYCRLPESSGTIAFHVDHIIPRKHNGTDAPDNLCLACYKCNGYKGYDIAGFDPETGSLSRLYHPCQQAWQQHFRLNADSTITGLTPEGRTTLAILQINEESRVQHRQLLTKLGDYPCP